ncbi:MAG: methylated-DNA--[protein]-cysteine S-methyltransferase [Rhodospirillales bacterium]|nr:MAG: methylated-DNA--[protein]-cysteine S-methyltransferase [Rhodospirillales bacterium]
MASILVDTPVGRLLVTEEDAAIVRVSWTDPAISCHPSALLLEAAAQLTAYFDRRLTAFDLPLNPRGTPFQRCIWGLLAAIPYGATLSYGALATEGATGPRAAAAACAANPLPILIPCHRVLGATGRLTGYSGGDGLTTKRQLLELERTHRKPTLPGSVAFLTPPAGRDHHAP